MNEKYKIVPTRKKQQDIPGDRFTPAKSANDEARWLFKKMGIDVEIEGFTMVGYETNDDDSWEILFQKGEPSEGKELYKLQKVG